MIISETNEEIKSLKSKFEAIECKLRITDDSYYRKGSSLKARVATVFTVAIKNSNLAHFTIRKDFNCGVYRLEGYSLTSFSEEPENYSLAIDLINELLDYICYSRSRYSGYQLYTLNNTKYDISQRFLDFTNFVQIGDYSNPNYEEDRNRGVFFRKHNTREFGGIVE